MSHISQSDRFTPPLRANQPDPRTSPLNALSNQSPQKVSSSSPRSGLSSKLIPRDYLSSKHETTSASDRLDSQNIDSMTTTRDLEYSSASTRYQPNTNNRSDTDVTVTSAAQLHAQRNGGSQASNGDRGDFVPVGKINTQNLGKTSPLPQAQPVGLKGTNLPSNMPRTSSIDSAISSASPSSMQNRNVVDTRPPSPRTLRNLIDTAGGAENLVLHLLKEKNQAATQNAQLWKLVEKQRALLIGLNKDLEKATKERDKYRKKLKDLSVHEPLPLKTPQQLAKATPSPLSSSHSQKPASETGFMSGPVRPVQLPTEDDGSLIEGPGPAIDVDDQVSADTVSRTVTTNVTVQNSSPRTPVFSTNGMVTSGEKAAKSPPFSSRKAPPKPLKLSQTKEQIQEKLALIDMEDRANRAQMEDETDEEEDEDAEPSRGRRKTRAEDDHDREIALKKEQEARSRSKKSSQPPESTNGEVKAMPGPSLPLSPRPQVQKFMVAGLGSVNPTALHPASHDNTLTVPLRSPGLPASPRPMNQVFQNINSLPLSPRAATGAFPLSPRAPKQPIPLPMSAAPFTDPASQQRQNNLARQVQIQNQQQTNELSLNTNVPPVFKGLVSPSYPDLLLPPNALPSIQVKVASSRLKPSRNSMLGMKIHEDSIVFSLSIFSRANNTELWRIEKVPAALPVLEQQLRPKVPTLPRLPDRKLFSGQAPTLVDQRRQAIDAYFEDLLDIHIDEQSALYICRFLSTDVLNPDDAAPKSTGAPQEGNVVTGNVTGKTTKAGWLTKRGKNFGGWKSRYFVLDSTEFRYFETPGGPLIGTIKIGQARISTQRSDEGSSDAEDPYRHAFLIQEPKKKDSATFVRHILCAESDAERDGWVAALLQYTEHGSKDLEIRNTPVDAPIRADPRPTLNTFPIPRDKRQRSDDLPSESTSPTSISSTGDSSVAEGVTGRGNISGPMNGAVISNTAQWGNKPTPIQMIKDKPKKSNIFHFRKTSQEAMSTASKNAEAQLAKPRILRHNGYVRPVFGLSLSDAVEFCAPFNVDIKLPAVVYRCIEYLQYRHAESEEGIFRLSGSNVVVKNLKERFNTEGDVDLVDDEEYHDVHAVASLFKNYLRELPTTILTKELHLEFLQHLEVELQEQKIKAFNVLVHRLPAVNIALLKAMCSFLIQVIDNAAKSKMSVKNIGIIFSPTLNIPVPVFTLFLTEFNAIFETVPNSDSKPVGQGQTRTVEVTAPSTMSAGDIRSPRHQMFTDLPTPAYNQTTFKNNMPGFGSAPNANINTPGDFGMVPMHQSYESGNYVSMVQGSRQPNQYPPIHKASNSEDVESYGSLDKMLVPENAPSAKARKRESAILF